MSESLGESGDQDPPDDDAGPPRGARLVVLAVVCLVLVVVVVGWLLFWLLTELEEPWPAGWPARLIVCMSVVAVAAGGLSVFWVRSRSGEWPTLRFVRLVLFVVALPALGVALIWRRSGSRDLWTIPGRRAALLQGWTPRLPDIDGYIDRQLVVALILTFALLVAISLPFQTFENPDQAGTPWWRRTDFRAGVAVVAVAGFLACELRGNSVLRDVAGGAAFDPDPDDVAWLQRLYQAKWLFLAVAVVMIAGLWTRRAPLGPDAPDAQNPLEPDRPPKDEDEGSPQDEPDRPRQDEEKQDEQKQDEEEPWAPCRQRLGISVSGGGIRSAAFALGALEELRRDGVLAKAAYVTSVSGGGYTTSALEHLNRERLEEDQKAEEQRRRKALHTMRSRLGYLLTDTPHVLSALVRLLLGVLVNVWVIYLVIFAVVRPVGWFVGMPLVQENLRVDTPYVAEVVAGDDPDLRTVEQPWYERCKLYVSPEDALRIVPDEAGAGRSGASAFALNVPTQCVRVVGTGGSSYVTFDVTTTTPGLIRFDDRDASVVRQPEVKPDNVVPLDEDTPGFDVEEFTRLLVDEDTLVDISAPHIAVADGGKVASSRTSLDEVLSEPGSLSISVRSIIDQRTKPVLDIDTRHILVPLVPLLLALVLWLAGGSIWGQQLLHHGDGDKVPRRRERLGRVLRWCAWGGLLLLSVFLVLPWLVKELPEGLTTFLDTGPSDEQTSSVPWMPAGLPPVVAWPVLAIGTVVGFFRQNKLPAPDTSKRKRKRNVTALLTKVLHFGLRVAVALVLIILVVVSAVTILATAAANGPFGNRAWISQEMFGTLISWPSDLVLWTIIVAVLLLSRTWFSAGVWSLGAYYRSRLRWAFAEDRDENAAFVSLDDPTHRDGAANPRAERFGRLADTNAELVVCCAANIRGPDRAPAGRNATSFTVSRSWIGGPELGWMKTEKYLRRLSPDRQDDLTIPSMTAISGAAVSPAMGKSSLGPLGAVLAVLNVRLGGWLPHPGAVKRLELDKRTWRHTPGWPYFLRETLLRYRYESPYVYVSDGGHWENLGLVEALRRGCNQVIAISAAGDGVYSNATIGQAVEIARTDLDIDIELDDVWAIRPLAGDGAPKPEPRQYLQQDGDEASVRRLARQGFAFGTFTRGGVDAPNDRGTILLIEAAMVDGLPVDVHSYAESHPEFPDVSTGDQFFQNADFEAYRRLGQFLAAQAIGTGRGGEMIRRIDGQPPVPSDP